MIQADDGSLPQDDSKGDGVPPFKAKIHIKINKNTHETNIKAYTVFVSA